jgi:hypothetical protein
VGRQFGRPSSPRVLVDGCLHQVESAMLFVSALVEQMIFSVSNGGIASL